jgi:hypothetical protein
VTTTKRTKRAPKRPPGTRLRANDSDAAKARALVAYRESGTVVHACIAAGIARRTWYQWLEADPAFASAAVEASEAVLDDLEKEAIKRAKDGSDTLIIFLLKCLRSNKFQDRRAITMEVVSPEVRSRVRWMFAVARSRPTWTTAVLLEALMPVWSQVSTIPPEYREGNQP